MGNPAVHTFTLKKHQNKNDQQRGGLPPKNGLLRKKKNENKKQSRRVLPIHHTSKVHQYLYKLSHVSTPSQKGLVSMIGGR